MASVTSVPLEAVATPPIISKPTALPKENSRPKTTISLNDIFKNSEKSDATVEKKEEIRTEQNQPITLESLKHAWSNFAEQRKDQVAEYHLMQQPFDLKDNTITIHLTNPIEEPLLQSIKSTLVEYLRAQLKNYTIQVTGTLKAIESKKMAYTNKEKFDRMVEKNPMLAELKARFGLDPDF